jgi:TolB-like protein/tetratricopeptide (TPR) repeat protein
MTEATNQSVHEETVFLSYSREDQKRARPIIAMLADAGFQVWWDGLLEGGERFSHRTEAALEGAKAVVVLWSKTSTASHWVHDEATRGRDRGVLVPLSIDGSEAPLGFRQFQVIDATPAKAKPGTAEMQAMLRAVSTLHDRPFDAAIAAKSAQPAISRRSAMVAGGAAAFVGSGLVVWQTGLFGGSIDKTSIAVLPFANLSNDPEQRYFSDGLASEIRSRLARNSLLQVAAQTSSNAMRDLVSDAKTISKKLRVAYLLEGDVRRSDDKVRVDIRLVDGRTGFEKKEGGRTFDRPLANIFEVQSEIAAAIATALSAQIVAASGDTKGKQPGSTENIAAFDAYLRGKDLFDSGAGETSDRLALAKFEEAIKLDPRYSAAFAARARSLAVIANQHGRGDQLKELYRASVAAARQAVKLAPDYAEAHSALGFALANGQLDMRAAKVPYDKSKTLGSGDADILSRYAIFVSRFKRYEDATQAITQATALDPLNARTFRNSAFIHYAARRYDDSIKANEAALEINPKLGSAYAAIGNSLLMQGKLDKAEAAYLAETNSLFGLPGIAIIAHRKGDPAKAKMAVAEMIAEHGTNSLYQQAQIHAQWGDKAKAMEALQAAYAAGDAGMVSMNVDPLLDLVRNEPAFSRLLSQIGFV